MINKNLFLPVFLAAVLIAAGMFMACSAGAAQAPQQQDGLNTAGNSTAAMSPQGPVSTGNTQEGQAANDSISLLLRAEDYDKDIETARSALEVSPADQSLKQKLADAYIARAWFYKTKRLTTYTLADLSRAVEEAPDYYRSHYEIGLFHNNQWMFSIGLLDFNKTLALKPDFAPAYAERAYSNYKNQKFDQALSDVNKAIELDPAVSRSYCVRSLVYAATSKLDLAMEDANKAVSIAPGDAFSYYNRSLVYTTAGKPEPAIADLETTLQLSQDDLLTARANEALQKLKK